MRVFRVPLSISVCASFPFGFEGGIWDLIVYVPDHCLYFYKVAIPPAAGSIKTYLPGCYSETALTVKSLFLFLAALTAESEK